jgi:hypothetical protein
MGESVPEIHHTICDIMIVALGDTLPCGVQIYTDFQLQPFSNRNQNLRVYIGKPPCAFLVVAELLYTIID